MAALRGAALTSIYQKTNALTEIKPNHTPDSQNTDRDLTISITVINWIQ